MKFQLLIAAALSAILHCAYAQPNDLIIGANINLPKDSVVKRNLLLALNGFLANKEKPVRDNPHVLRTEALETAVLLDEMKGIEKSAKYKDDHFYKGYLTNISPIRDSAFLIQFSYIGEYDHIPLLRASFRVLAIRKQNQFYFTSLLLANTKNWKKKRIGECTFYYPTTFLADRVKEYESKVSFFDHKLQAAKQEMQFYGCHDFPEVLQLVGVDYKSEYNGGSSNSLSSSEGNRTVTVNGVVFGDFKNTDIHDLWHARLHRVVSTDIINRPVDEGCAYLYGGSWGVAWPVIFQTFKDKLCTDASSDWVALYDGMNDFGNDKAKPMYAAYVINALLVQKIEREKGFAAVMDLLRCGKYEKNNDNYFKALEKITGISRATFNDAVWKLIKAG